MAQVFFLQLIVFGQDFLASLNKPKKHSKCDLCGYTSEQKPWHRVKTVGRAGRGEKVPDGRRCEQCWLAAAWQKLRI